MVFRYCGNSPSQAISEIEEILLETNWTTGDINFDEAINILDVISLVNNILLSSYNFNSDLNLDYTLNIQDIIILIGIILDN